MGSLWFAKRTSRVTHFTLNDLALHGELVDGASEGLFGHLLAHTRKLEHDAARLDVGDPPLGGTPTGAHAGLSRLLGQRTVGVDVDPHLSAALDVTGHRNTSRLDLAVGHEGVLNSLD